MNEVTKETIQEWVCLVSKELGNVLYDDHYFEDRYIKVVSDGQRWIDVYVKFPNQNVLVFQSRGGYVDTECTTVYRPGKWVLHLQGLFERAMAKRERIDQESKAEKIAALMPIYDDEFFANGGNYEGQTNPKAKTTLEELAELIHQLIEDAVYNHME